MRLTPIYKSQAFTRFELTIVVIIVSVFVLFPLSVIVSARKRAHYPHDPNGRCINDLRQIGFAYRVWANDHDDRFPALASGSEGGWRDLLTKGDQGFLCWTNYTIMADELGQSQKILICPLDERQPAESFTNFANTNLSYFVGVSADASQPRSLLAGDRNLGGGATPDRAYGFSPESGQGNDVAIQTNPQTGPVCWSLKMHSQGNSAGAGNILLGDGSVQQVSTLSFRTNWQPFAGQTTTWPAGHTPKSPSVRVLFP